MDDCNLPASFSAIRSSSLVQIPLWTIVTAVIFSLLGLQACSDSSMDDCNLSGAQYRFRSDGSDSSMDDCNSGLSRHLRRASPFRFLYGRL